MPATFLKIIDPATGLFQVMNVVSFDEEPLAFLGVRRRSFAGNPLSTQRTPKRTFKVTVEFPTGTAYEQFRLFISALDIFGRMIVPKPMQMVGGTLVEDVTPTARNIDIELGAAHSLGEQTPDSGAAAKFGWSLDLTLIER